MHCHRNSLLFTGLMACAAFATWFLLRGRPTDRSAIDLFAKQHGLRIVSVARSYNIFRYWFRGISVTNTARFYDIAVEDSEGNQGNIQLVFDSLLAPRRLDVLGQQGLTLTPSGSADSTQSDPRTEFPGWTWYERLALFGVGVGLSGFAFSGILHTNLSAPTRPVHPDPALGYIHLFTTKYGDVYGTYFEYLAVSYGIFGMWGFGAVCALFGYILNVHRKSRTYPRQNLAAAAISMVLYYVIWRLFFSGARS